MTDSIQTMMDILKGLHIRSSQDPDGDIAFNYEGFSYVLCFDQEEKKSSCLMLPNVWRITQPHEVSRVLTILNNINSKIKLVKGVMKDHQVSFMIDLWLPDPLLWQDYLLQMRMMLIHAVHLFVDDMEVSFFKTESGIE